MSGLLDVELTLQLGNFACFDQLLIWFYKIHFIQKIFFQKYHYSQEFRSRSGPIYIVGLNIGLNFLQRLSAEDIISKSECREQNF